MVVSSTDYKIVLESIKDLLPKSYTIIQLRSKVRKFRDKYDKLISGVKNPNENDPHQEKLFELSKNYWGDTIKPKVLKEMHEVPYYYLDQFCRVNNASLTLPPSLLAITAKKGWEESIGKANAAYLNKKSKDLMIVEGEVFVQRCQVILDQTKLMLDVLKQ
ncbi:hypothetical protein FRX31_031498 [Thalictrum thalictroides]|uniref:Glabrous enhancer-binding protein-like DBD domain-containing protein n=1 Tax=Thalictrum thalictroides TaxID=46969 RepID=A0A7J6V434_THATH|nr:hypothetical protein FRX31_031498 [Thalictrum thalictroides]